MNNARIFLSPPHLSGVEEKYVHEAFLSNYIAPLGPHVDIFEKEFSQYLDVPYAVALSSGTAALHLSIILAGIEPSDNVICSTLTFSASANVIRYVGAKPIFVDSNKETWNIDPDLVEEEILEASKSGRRIKALVSVDLYGQCADYLRLQKICSENGLILIEDAAEAMGATYKGKKAGNFGLLAAFSFNGNKIMTTSGGGMLMTSQESLARRARFLSTQARDPAPHYQHTEIGYNYRMSNILAAIGRGQLTVIDDRVSRKREIFSTYYQALSTLPGIAFMPEAAFCRSNRWLTCLTVDPNLFGADREDIRIALESENIESRPIWKPMHMQPVFSSFQSRERGVAQELFTNGLCLPSGTNMSESDQNRVIECIKKVHTDKFRKK